MNYTKEECKFFIKYNRCSHRSAPKPYHSQCLGKKQCIVWNDPITNRALDANSPIHKAAQEMYEALIHARAILASIKGEEETFQIVCKALAKAEGKEELGAS
jgi:hypothetical protein